MARKAVDPVTQYARDVVAARIVAGRGVRLACERHLRDLKRKDLVWRPAAAQLAIDFYPEMLVLEDGAPFRLLPYQQFIVGSIFGWYKPDGFRRYHDAYVETGKGSGKTPMAAGVGLIGLIADNEPAAEIYSAATMKDQARIAWMDAERMVQMSPELNEAVKQEAGCLTYGNPERVFRPVSSEHKGLDGKRPHIAIIDELHEHPTGMVVHKMKAGTKRRRNSIIFRITNSGFDRTSVCWKEHDYSIKVLEGTVRNDAWFAYVCMLDEGDDWHDEKVWPKANPGMHADLPPISYLRDQVTNAVGMPSMENITKRLNFCVWTEADEHWLDMEAWDKCNAPVSLEALAGTSCFAGLDGASTNDIFSFLMLFGPDEAGIYDVVPRFWIPEETLSAQASGRDERTRLQLREWADQGFVRTTPGKVIEDDIIEEQVLEELARYNLKELAFDRWGVRQLITHLKDKLGTRRNLETGKEESRVIDFPQNIGGMSAASKRLEELVAGAKLRHGGHPVLRWMASNAAIKHGPNEQIKVDREKSSEKIDGIIALVMAVARAMVDPQEPPDSEYERRAASNRALDESGAEGPPEELIDSW